MKDSFYSDF